MGLAETVVLEDHVKLGTDMANNIFRGFGPLLLSLSWVGIAMNFFGLPSNEISKPPQHFFCI